MVNLIGGQQYSADYSNDTLANTLSIVVRVFHEWAQQERLVPLVVFIPQNKYDVSSPYGWIEQYRQKHKTVPEMLVMDTTGLDWERDNLRANGDCHPSAYGYGNIGAFYAKAIKDRLER